ncbi:hypothetical protein CR205_13095 [Alteribacter lacisalsi]|uniref:Type I restriction modification DNA specificity domain-containing protein n=1 Tax=Alteribacter lacisalsi TaxID=2045244 RepID=A0A2W0H465_9BACI|nr:restriction endonuclease subunit S [Alteribacter lacisalsi]PYZ96634.1 hypothetical protein CR205_13095 [Alteribacter lacisalsi]
MSSKKNSIEEQLEDALVPIQEQPYKIPENWVWVKSEYIAKWGSGGTPSRKKGEYYHGDIPWLKTGELRDNVIYNSKEMITEEGLRKSSAKLFKKGSVAIAMYGATIGRLGILGIDASTNQACAVGTPHSMTYNKFMFYYFLARRKSLIELGKGGAQPNISQTIIKSFPYPLPPYNEQKRIADKVQRLLTKVDEAKQLIEEAKESFKLRKEGILKKAFEGKFTRKWRSENGTTNLAEREEFFSRIKEQRLDVVQTKRELNEVSEMYNRFDLKKDVDENGWLLMKANMFCHNVNCGKTPSKAISDKEEIPFLKVYNIVNNKINFSYKQQFIPKDVQTSKLKSSALYPGDVIMNIVGPPLKKIAIIPSDFPEWNMNQAIVRFRPIKQVLPKYVYYCLQYERTLEKVINNTRGVVGQTNISVRQSRNLVMPIPPIEEQNELVKVLDETLDKELYIKELLEQEKTLDLLKQTILSKAFCGRLGTRDPNEESVFELIKRNINS